MKPLSTHELALVSGGFQLPLVGSLNRSLSRRGVPLMIVGVSASIAHQVGGLIAGENLSIRYLLGSAIASMATTPLLADAGVTHCTSLKTAITTVYAMGFHGYVQGLVTQQPDIDSIDDDGEEDIA